MLRGAPETSEQSVSEVLQRMKQPEFQSWLLKQFEVGTSLAGDDVRRMIPEIVSNLRHGRSGEALELLYRHHLVKDAAACDLIESALQSPLAGLAHSEIAERVRLTWYPDYVCLLFDADTVAEELRSRILACTPELDSWPVQDWELASQLADEVISRRDDLGWAFTVAGWGRQRRSELAQALDIYWAGRFASSFADQSVRLNCHGFTEQTGKFAIEQLLSSPEGLAKEHWDEPYFQLFRAPHSRSLLSQVHEFWWNRGVERHLAADYAAAYDAFYCSGWDLGVSRLSDYGRILKALAQTAKAAGWQARRRVAETHLTCLVNR
jgi:hypothetical protein